MFKKKIYYICAGVLLIIGLSAGFLYQQVNNYLTDLPKTIQVVETVETSLKTHLFEMSGSKKMVLATLKHYEIFEKKSEMTLFNNRLKLPDIIVRASMPVEYNYFVEFDQRWDITTSENSMTVIAPGLQALRPSVNISEIEFEVKKGSFFRRDSLVSEELRQELDTLLGESAQGHLPSIREVARLELKELIELWSIKSESNLEIKVFFADEVETQAF